MGSLRPVLQVEPISQMWAPNTGAQGLVGEARRQQSIQRTNAVQPTGLYSAAHTIQGAFGQVNSHLQHGRNQTTPGLVSAGPPQSSSTSQTAQQHPRRFLTGTPAGPTNAESVTLTVMVMPIVVR